MLDLSTYKKTGHTQQTQLCRLLFGAKDVSHFAASSGVFRPSVKYALFERLLELLSQYIVSPPEVELRRELNKLRVLQERQLYEEAIRRASRKAIEAEETLCIPEALRLHEFGNLLVLNHFRLQVNEVSVKEERRLTEQHLRIIDLREMLLKMYRIEFRTGQPHAPAQQAAFRKLWNNELSRFAPATLPQYARATLYNARGLVLNRLGRFAESVKEYEKAVGLLSDTRVKTERLWKLRKSNQSKQEGTKILKRFVRPKL
ncbi:MAG: hypothetical protein FJ212_04580 [Ignavibacteria bacterium]|nr:hypothetical protein [Ignavibacteria bacterium]